MFFEALLLYMLSSSYLMIKVWGCFIFLVDCNFYHHITFFFVSLNAFDFEGPFITSDMFLFFLVCIFLIYLFLIFYFWHLFIVLNVFHKNKCWIFNPVTGEFKQGNSVLLIYCNNKHKSLYFLHLILLLMFNKLNNFFFFP